MPGAGVRQGSRRREPESSREAVYRMRRQVAESGLAFRSDEPQECRSLQDEVEAERGLVGLRGVMRIFGRDGWPPCFPEGGEAGACRALRRAER
jgi:hypothetical protein